MATILQALAIAIEHHQAGRLPEAEQIYRQILAVEPNNVDALHLVGVVAHQVGRHEIAIEFIRRAIELKGNQPAFHSNLGNAFRDHGKLEEAITCYRRALVLKPDFVQGLNNLGIALGQQGKLDEAIVAWRRAVRLMPDYADAHYNLGNALRDLGKTAEAVASWRRAIERKPDHAEAHNNLGHAFIEEGNLDEAIAAWHRAIQAKPDFAEAHNNLGNALQKQRKFDEAIACHQRALELNPDYAEAHSNLGVAMQEMGQLDKAVACYTRALALKPNDAEAHYNLGNAQTDRGNRQKAIACYRRALEWRADYAQAYINLGNALKEDDKPDEAIACWRRAIELEPDNAMAHNNLAVVLRERGRLEEAVSTARRALALKPDYPEAHNTLGNALKDRQEPDQAADCYRRALELKPDYAEARVNLGVAIQEQGLVDEAIACFERAIEAEPDLAEAHNNLANAFKDQGKLEEAIACYRRAIEMKLDYAAAHSNLLYTLQYQEGADLSSNAAAHEEYERQHIEPLRASRQPHSNAADPGRRLRVGFVSPDFGRHPVGYFSVRALENLGRGRLETVCYSDRLIKDEITTRFQSAATTWRDITGLGDADVATRIVADRIDVLFDLAGHTGRNRLLVFARKPAPLQITWLGYEGTTGVDAIDYILADRHTIPPGWEPFYREQVLRMPDGYVCYDPPLAAPEPAPLPALVNGFVRFGSFNNPAKITPRVVEVWAKVICGVPQSRLMLKYQGWGDESVCTRYRRLFAARGVDAARLEFAPRTDHAGYLAAYRQIDLALDPFPFGGGITTCDALWMGVPVLTCPGETFASRHGLSHLSNVGLTQTIAASFDEYVQLAVSLAGDLPRLDALRAGLRPRVEASPLCDGKRFAEHLETIVRGVWRDWCRTEARRP